MSKLFSEGYLRHPGFDILKPLGKGTAPNEEMYHETGSKGSLAGYRSDLGHSVRSSVEANVARCFLIQGMDYIYEPEAFALNVNMGKNIFQSEQLSYIPDFYIPSTGDYIELKGKWVHGGNSGERTLMKLAMFIEQYPDKNLVLIQSYDYRMEFPGLNLRFKEEILVSDMEQVFAVPIKEHTELSWWESGTKKSGINIKTCPNYLGRSSDIEDDKTKIAEIMEWKGPSLRKRMSSDLNKHELEFEAAKREVNDLESRFNEPVDTCIDYCESILQRMGELTHGANCFVIPDLCDFEEYEERFWKIIGAITFDIKNYKFSHGLKINS